MIPIEEIDVGDFVWSYNFEKSDNELCQVTKTFKRTTDEIVFVNIGNESIETTSEHPFYVYAEGWTKAESLSKGTVLRNQSDDAVIVQSISIAKGEVPVYNFEVEESHTYYVSSSKILVHNMCVAKSVPTTLQAGGHTLNAGTLKALKLSPEEGRTAITN